LLAVVAHGLGRTLAVSPASILHVHLTRPATGMLRRRRRSVADGRRRRRNRSPTARERDGERNGSEDAPAHRRSSLARWLTHSGAGAIQGWPARHRIVTVRPRFLT